MCSRSEQGARGFLVLHHFAYHGVPLFKWIPAMFAPFQRASKQANSPQRFPRCF
jgi:hypothetical protein